MNPKYRANSKDSPTAGLMTHGEVAQLLGITRQRVYQIERGALLKIRAALEPFYLDWNALR